MPDEHQETRDAYRRAVNMSPRQLAQWLDRDESKQVGQKSAPGTESTGHRSGRRILRLHDKKATDYTERDYRFMRKVVGYVERHRAQRPDGDVTHTPWRYSLMNWGHDPTKGRRS